MSKYFAPLVNGSSNEVYATVPELLGQLIVSGIPSPSVSVSAHGSLGKSSAESFTPSPSESVAITFGTHETMSSAINSTSGLGVLVMCSGVWLGLK